MRASQQQVSWRPAAVRVRCEWCAAARTNGTPRASVTLLESISIMLRPVSTNVNPTLGLLETAACPR
jgi:hypothetical protein